MNVRRNLLEQAATGAINPQAIEDQVRPSSHACCMPAHRLTQTQWPRCRHHQLNDIAEIEKKGPVREWVQMEAPRRHIAKKFHSFLSSFVDDKGNAIYTRRISEMCAGTAARSSSTRACVFMMSIRVHSRAREECMSRLTRSPSSLASSSEQGESVRGFPAPEQGHPQRGHVPG
jgi:hypothetical protein